MNHTDGNIALIVIGLRIVICPHVHSISPGHEEGVLERSNALFPQFMDPGMAATGRGDVF
jgi:hypothetical protein